MSEDEFNIPVEWPIARAYLQTKLEDRRNHLDRRDDALDFKIAALEQEVQGVRLGVTALNESFRHVADQHSVLMSVIADDQRAQHARWKEYDDEHKALIRIATHTDTIVTKEDTSRFFWRLAILVGLYATFAAIVAQKVSA